MRVAVSAQGARLDAAVDPRFGRCPTFLLVQTDDLSFEVLANESASLGGGAGIQTAQRLAQSGVQAVLTGHCGPNAHQTLSAAGIEIFVGCSGTVAEVLERLRAGKLRAAAGPDVESHSGMGGAGR